jgi:putative colanic acid biosynthesis acetyltransferase WcaF
MPREAAYRASDHIGVEYGTDAYTRPAFSRRNRAARTLWNLCRLLLYRPSPRALHGWRAALLRLFGAQLGPHCHFYPRSRVWAPWNLHCADHVAAADGVEIYNPSLLELGSHVILSQDSYLCGATHDYNDPAFPLIAYRMRLDAHAWICARAIVAPGIHVGEGAVLGLGSVATRDLAAWTVYSGHPAQAIRQRLPRVSTQPSAAQSSATQSETSAS